MIRSTSFSSEPRGHIVRSSKNSDFRWLNVRDMNRKRPRMVLQYMYKGGNCIELHKTQNVFFFPVFVEHSAG